MLILASASPRRRELLARVGFELDVQPADVDETELLGEDPAAYVARIADAKARAIVRAPGDWVLAADTTVTIDGRILAKAADPEEVGTMLRLLSNRVHEVLTAFVIRGDDVHHAELVATQVTMIELTEATIADYAACGEWRGKAGAYALQGIGASLVRGVHGSVTNVIGLPLVEVIAALRAAGGPTPRFTAGISA